MCEYWAECEIIIDVGTRKVNVIDALWHYSEEELEENEIENLKELEVDDMEAVDIGNFWYVQDFFEENKYFKHNGAFYRIIK